MPVVVASALWLSTHAGAVLPPSSSSVDRTALVERLASESLADRDLALKQLSVTVLSPSELCGLIQRSTSPEQRARLSLLGPESMRRTPRAAMGIRFSQDDTRAVVQATLDGFDAKRALRSGDVMLSIDGQGVAGQGSARPIIVSHDPGQEIDVQVLRAGKVVAVRVTLGDFKSLDRDDPRGFGSQLSMADMERAWDLRLAREAPRDGQAPLAGAVTSEQWSRLAEAGELRRTRAMIVTPPPRAGAFWMDAPVVRGEPAGPMVRPDADVVVGGEPRGGTEAAMLTGRRAERVTGRAGATGRDLIAELNKTKPRIDRMFQIQRELADRGTPAERRAELERELRDIQSAIFADVEFRNPIRGTDR